MTPKVVVVAAAATAVHSCVVINNFRKKIDAAAVAFVYSGSSPLNDVN